MTPSETHNGTRAAPRHIRASLTAAEVCEALGIKAWELPILLFAGELRITEESVEEYIARRLPVEVP